MLQLPELEQKLTVTTKYGEVLKVCLGLMLFYPWENIQENRKSVLKIFDEYTEFINNRYRWTQNPQTYSWKFLKHGRDSYLQPRDWIMDLPEYECWYFLYHGGKKGSDASNIEFFAFCGAINMILLQFPVEGFAEAKVGLPELAQRWSEILQPAHGYGGFCLGRSHGYEFESSSYEYQLAQRYLGLDVRNPQFHCSELHKGIKGADWLVILSEKYLEKLGGLQTVKQAMGEMPLLEYNGGAVLQAGAGPQLGDIELGEVDIPEYRRVAAIVEPVRAKNHTGMHIGNAPKPCFTTESYRRWLARFSPVAE